MPDGLAVGVLARCPSVCWSEKNRKSLHVRHQREGQPPATRCPKKPWKTSTFVNNNGPLRYRLRCEVEAMRGAECRRTLRSGCRYSGPNIAGSFDFLREARVVPETLLDGAPKIGLAGAFGNSELAYAGDLK